MKPFRFTESNTDFVKPDSMEEHECGTLPAYLGEVNGHMVVISVWEFEDDAERQKFLETGKLRLIVYGSQMPPVSLDPTFV